MTSPEVMGGGGGGELFKTLNQLHGAVAHEPSHMEVAFKPSSILLVQQTWTWANSVRSRFLQEWQDFSHKLECIYTDT